MDRIGSKWSCLYDESTHKVVIIDASFQVLLDSPLESVNDKNSLILTSPSIFRFSLKFSFFVTLSVFYV